MTATGALVGASWLAVRRTPLIVPALAALGLVAVTYPWQESGHAVGVMHGVILLAGAAWAATTDDPSGEVLAGSPFPLRRRACARLVAGLLVVLPVYVVGAIVAESRFSDTPLLPLAVEGAGYLVAAVAIGSAFRAAGHLMPSYLAMVGLVGLAVTTYVLPRGWTMVDPQPWGPPLTAACARWAGLGLLAVAVLVLALRDPANRRV
jgi:hypothetical protein